MGRRGKPFSNGTLRVFLDEQATPVIEAPIADIVGGGQLTGPPLSEGVSPETDPAQQGHNLYLPIPYAKHCKITYATDAPMDVGARQGEALYYQINYRTYESGTAVKSFSLDQLHDRPAPALLADVQGKLARSDGPSLDNLKREQVPAHDLKGQPLSISLSGPAVVRRLMFKLSAADMQQALRSTVLQIKFDGEACVWCPIGEFFGGGYRGSPFRSWYAQVSADGSMSCFWSMPFQRNCEISLQNLSNQPVRAEGEVDYGSWKWDDRSMHFHSAWRQYTDIDTRSHNKTGGGHFDVNYVELKGQGVYVGDTLCLFNGASAWWGEGDEKIYVDGESFPSHFGTGSEDYYGYAWSKPTFFESPFHAQPSGKGNVQSGYSVNSRYRGLDGIPFQKSLKFDMELWHWAETKMNFAPTTFWYARPGCTTNVEPDPKTALLPVAQAPRRYRSGAACSRGLGGRVAEDRGQARRNHRNAASRPIPLEWRRATLVARRRPGRLVAVGVRRAASRNLRDHRQPDQSQ